MKRLLNVENQLKPMVSQGLKLRCYVYDRYGYRIHIICAAFPSGELDANWKPLNDLIATTVQSKIGSAVERYNMYILFFEEDIDAALREAIETDKYCCRKIIMTEKMPEDEEDLTAAVENRLFVFNESTSEPTKTESAETLINSLDTTGKLFTLIKSSNGKMDLNDWQKMIEILVRPNN